MKKLVFPLATALLLSAGVAAAYPRHDPNVFDGGSLWEITYYHDTSVGHTQWATQRICFSPYTLPGAGETNIRGRWYSTTYPNWHGHYQQEGDTVKMVGNFWDGRGNDSMLWDIVTSSRANIGAGHWLEWGDNGARGPVYGMGNTLFKRVGTCYKITAETDQEFAEQVELLDIVPRRLSDGRVADHPMQEGQEALGGANYLEKLFDGVK